MAAVVGPIGIYHAQLGDGGVAPFLAEIGLTESDIVCVHGKAVLLHHGRQSRFFQLNEARQCGNAIGGRVFRGQRRLLFQRDLACLHRVDDIFFDGRKLGFADTARKQEHARRSN